MTEYDEYYEDYYESERISRSFCDCYQTHESHYYNALNGNIYSCSGLSVDELARIEEEWSGPPCVHGLSAHLCSGPNHYGEDS